MENSGLGRLGEFLLFKAVGRRSGEVRSEVRAHLMQAALVAVVILIGAITLILGLLTLFLYLCERMSQLEAAAWMTGGFLLLTIFLWLTVYFLPLCRSKGQNEPGRGQKTPPDTTAALMSDITSMIVEHPGKASLAAMVAGMVVGYFPEVRSLLVQALADIKNQEKPED
jgi:hypothetical protein